MQLLLIIKSGETLVTNMTGMSHCLPYKVIMLSAKQGSQCYHFYRPFHSSLPFEHLGQSSLCVNKVTFYSILEPKECARCQVFLKSIQHLSLGINVTSADKKHNCNCLVKAYFYFKILCTTYRMHIKNTHMK